jgi:hypothetical protein
MIDLVLYGVCAILVLIVFVFVGLCCAEIKKPPPERAGVRPQGKTTRERN